MLTFIRKSNRSFVLETVVTAAVIAASMFIACPAAFAGGPGNGGDAVFINGKWTLLDLAEAGITVSPYFEGRRTYFQHAKTEGSLARGFVNSVFIDRRFTPEFRAALAATLNSYQDSPALIAAMRMYQWQLTDAPLLNVGDEHSTLDLSKMKVAQLATRLDDRIQIYAPIFTKMDLLNQVATIHHELTYSLTKPIADSDGTLFQPSWQARSRVACVFSGREGCGSMAGKMYAKGKPIFESSPLSYIGYFATAQAQDGTQYPIYREHPTLVLCDMYAEELTVRTAVNGALYGDPVLVKGLPNSKCVTMGSIMGMTSPTNRIPFGGHGVDSFCTVNQNGNVTKKTSGQMKVYDVATNVFWEFEELSTATGSTRRPVVANAPFGKNYNASFIGESTYTSYEDCVTQTQNALAKMVERTKKSDVDLLRFYGE
jgi:hypothetical protein